MNTFKQAAFQVLKDAKKPLHSKRIVEIALKRGFFKTSGKTPEATMNAVLLVDIDKKEKKSRFIKMGPSTFSINPQYKRPELTTKTKVKNAISEEFVKNSVIIWLTQKGWKILEISNIKGRGVDIKAKKGNRYFFIETKGSSGKNQGNEVRFVYGLGQIITRMNVIARNAYLYAIASPSEVAKIARRRIPKQVARKLTLYILSIDSNGRVKRYSWTDLKS